MEREGIISYFKIGVKMSKKQAWLFLALAIISEVVGTSTIKLFDGEWYSYAILCAFIALAYYFMALSLGVIPVGLAYAVWEIVGVASIAVIGVFIFKEQLSVYQMLGIALGILGIILVNLGYAKEK